jgi:hypothetical protein
MKMEKLRYDFSTTVNKQLFPWRQKGSQEKEYLSRGTAEPKGSDARKTNVKTMLQAFFHEYLKANQPNLSTITDIYSTAGT